MLVLGREGLGSGDEMAQGNVKTGSMWTRIEKSVPNPKFSWVFVEVQICPFWDCVYTISACREIQLRAFLALEKRIGGRNSDSTWPQYSDQSGKLNSESAAMKSTSHSTGFYPLLNLSLSLWLEYWTGSPDGRMGFHSNIINYSTSTLWIRDGYNHFIPSSASAIIVLLKTPSK